MPNYTVREKARGSLVERRQHQRYIVSSSDFLVFRHEDNNVGWITDLSRGGLSYEYIPTPESKGEGGIIDIFVLGKKTARTRTWRRRRARLRKQCGLRSSASARGRSSGGCRAPIRVRISSGPSPPFTRPPRRPRWTTPGAGPRRFPSTRPPPRPRPT